MSRTLYKIDKDSLALIIYLVSSMLDDKTHDIVEAHSSLTTEQVEQGKKFIEILLTIGYSVYDLNKLRLELHIENLID